MSGIAPEPNYHGRKLQRQIKNLRQEARLTLREAGERVHIEFRKLSRLERRQLPTYHELVILLDVYGVLSCDYAPYVELWELAQKRSWWRDYKVRDVRYIRMEDEADSKYEFQASQIPTLLQTDNYARETLSRHSRNTVKTLTEIRMRQQERLTSGPLLTLHALIHEPVLRQEVDRAQIRKLVEYAALPNVTIQVVPQKRIQVAPNASVILLSFDDPDEHDIAFADTLIGLQETQDPKQTSMIKRTLDSIAKTAMSPDESTMLIQRTFG